MRNVRGRLKRGVQRFIMVVLFEKVMFEQNEVTEVRELAMKTSGRRASQVEKRRAKDRS